ncbi:hypothetical protein ETW24_12115 [Leisingera sp. NJS204]|nr:hypothetical protein ETW24_12115 [Leisingera sp. NJS204]
MAGRPDADAVSRSFIQAACIPHKNRHLDPKLEPGITTKFVLLADAKVTGPNTRILQLSAPSPSYWSANLTDTSGASIPKAAAETSDRYFEAARSSGWILPTPPTGRHCAGHSGDAF